MANRRGYYNYHHYRGKANKAKIALAVFLVLVILAAVAVILMQQNVVYDETGTPHIELPWKESAAAAETERPALDLVIEGTPDAQTEESAEETFGKMPEEALPQEPQPET